MYKDDVKRQEREAELDAEKSRGSKDLNNLIANDEESFSQHDEDVESFHSKKSAAKSERLNEDLKIAPTQ